MNSPAKPLFSKKYQIIGKPDYIIRKNNQYIPIEIKSGSNKHPHKNHILQLASYCQLIEENYRNFVPYGIIIYQDNDFRIPFNPSLRFELESIIKKMRFSLKNEKVILNHNDPGKCRFCSMRIFCANKLV
jgi:CRISPR-associated exonuclease Cas4